MIKEKSVTGKTVSSQTRMDEDTKQIQQERARAYGLSEAGYIRMLIRRDAGLALDSDHPSGRAKKTLRDLYRDLYKIDKHDIVEMKDSDEKKLLRAVHSLGERPRQIILDRYSEGLTLDQVGKRHALGKERIRQIIKKTLLKIRLEGV